MEPVQKQYRQINKKSLQESKDNFEKLMNSRSFYFLGSEIYGGVGGLYDWGPPGCALRTNVQQIWREHFILEEDMLEISTTCITPEVVFKHSGHIKKFADLVVRDEVNRRPERADKYLEQWTTNLLENEQKPPLSEEQIQRLKQVQQNAETYNKEEITEIYKELQIKSIDGNNFTEAEPFNLMFKSDIGPSGGAVGYLRPETAQGMFVNFNRLQYFNGGKMPFAAAQIGLGFRNEIAPRQQLIRVREFDMAEIEHFFDPEDHTHPRFSLYQQESLPLLSSERQLKGEETSITTQLGEAVKSGLICNETMGYFLIRTFQFLVKVGVNPQNIRFRQHKPKEMAHYANDCWDAEIETSSGWIECVGHANRSAYDLSCHSKGSGKQMLAARKLQEPKKVKLLELVLDNGKIGKEFQRKIQLNTYFQSLNEQEREQLENELKEIQQKEVKIVTITEKKDKQGNVIETKEKVTQQIFDYESLLEIKQQGEHIPQMMQTLKSHLETLSDKENREIVEHLKTNPFFKFEFEKFYVNFTKDMIKNVKEVEKTISEEKYQPNVIEPAFGLGRIITAILEHNFQVRPEAQEPPKEEEKSQDKKAKKGKKEAKSEQVKSIRAYLTLPPRVAPQKCSILPLMAKDVFTPSVHQIKQELTKAGISSKVDDTGVSVGKRYARTDEIGIPFGITVDYETIEEGALKGTVTLREIETTKQVRIPIKEVAIILQQLCSEFITWNDVLAKYPLQEAKE